MSYQVLARKWRPRNFQEMAGQSHVLKTLINALDNNRLHHAYLFTGTRGVGKTTIARILARCLNCETGVTSTPCGTCSACMEISEGRFIDLIEVDAASRTKVEDTRELLDNVQYAPTRGRFKVYLIDEVHMLSTHSFNALLKTLEEPPPHVKFLLATTDPQKLPVTVLSRCLQFNLKNLSPERLVEHMKYILGEEKIDFEDGALWQLGRAAQGSVRDCLTLLDQAIGFSESQLTEQQVSEFLGNLDRAVIIQLMDALIAEDAAAVMEQIKEAAEHSPDFALILQELLSWLHRVAVAQVVPDAIDNSQGDREQILGHAAALPAETIQLYYQVALKGREEMPFALDARSGLEMTLLRMLAFVPAGIPKVPERSLSGKPAVQDADTAEQKKKPLKPEPSAGSVSRTATEHKSPPSPLAPQATPAAHIPEQTSDANQVAVAKQTKTAQLQQSEPLAPAAVLESVSERQFERRPESAIESAIESPLERAAVQAAEPKAVNFSKTPEQLQSADWIPLFNQLDLSGVTRSIAGNMVLAAATASGLILHLAEQHATIFNDEHRKRIEQSLQQFFGCPVNVQVELAEVNSETPSAYRHRRVQEHQAQAMEQFNNSALVQALVNTFDGEVQQSSIKPLRDVEL